jgi:hypothetical protein
LNIYIKVNFIVPGLGNKESIEINRSTLRLREFLEHLSSLGPTRIAYVRPGAEILDPDDWEVEINGTPYQECEEGLEALLRDGDTVTLKILPLGGG